ncbi:hypothetical protein [Salinispora sp. H7-4]|uniref:hypothetical protein n=1 Tax=Salinispora sp. H7-4 TaxID=2748321 RepID=UPI0015D30DD0|nr:hypothetical protein [Salinispora sp. H7-4]NYT96426.1 hypothetical protein [Salinispora sp. H7-4]
MHIPHPPRLSTWWRTNPAILAIRENWPLAVATPIALAAAGALIWLLWLILTGLISGLGAAGGAIGDTVPAAATWVTDGPITRSISEPMRAWLDSNTAGLPATGRDAWITWLVAVCVLYAAAVAGSSYARIGWAVIGALTAAAVHAGAPEGTGPAAAGLTVAVWLLLSLPAYTATSRYSLTDILTDRTAPLLTVNERKDS